MARVYQAATMGEAQVRVAFVRDRGQADLLVHRVGNWGLARGDALWFITRDKQDATVWIYPCSLGMADVNICFVDNYAEAGWLRPHRLKGRFARPFA
ncbi:hypothetical protein E6C76_13970 [Pseudothauera nasutitermitis]|uniref:7(1) septoil knot domain-containing protein n=1 Tax=Pseudothauera nasutitermitis TaxID=2565930 RepID=A0A4S4AUP6_9RHOO|nr:DUF6150 family protein [Pseudothauera nasutitermitis]THF63691.1 hypothetical protein E6C76_13970 [Pseudothauera nasutitermitis]